MTDPSDDLAGSQPPASAPPGGVDVRRAIERPRSTRRRIRLGDVDRLRPRIDGDGGGPGRGWMLGVLAAVAGIVALVLRRRDREAP